LNGLANGKNWFATVNFKFYLPILNANGRKKKEPWRGGGALDAVKRSNEMSLNPMEFYCAFVFRNTEECARLQHDLQFFLEMLVH